MTIIELAPLFALHFWWQLLLVAALLLLVVPGFRQSRRMNRCMRILALAAVVLALFMFQDRNFIIEPKSRIALAELSALGSDIKSKVSAETFSRLSTIYQNIDEEFDRVHDERARLRTHAINILLVIGLCSALGGWYYRKDNQIGAPQYSALRARASEAQSGVGQCGAHIARAADRRVDMPITSKSFKAFGMIFLLSLGHAACYWTLCYVGLFLLYTNWGNIGGLFCMALTQVLAAPLASSPLTTWQHDAANSLLWGVALHTIFFVVCPWLSKRNCKA